MIYEKQVRTLLCGLREGLLYASIPCIILQEEYDIWETGEDTSMRPPWRSTIYASILWYINTRGIWYMRNKWGHFYAASVKVYYMLRYYGITLQEEYDIWETGEDTPMRPPWRSTIYASILWYNNTRIWYMRNRWGHFYAASVKVYYTLRYYGISIQEEYDIWETGEDTSMRPPWRSTIFASIV